MIEKYEFIDPQCVEIARDSKDARGLRNGTRVEYAYPVAKMCEWLGVSRSGFYEWRDRPASATASRREKLAAAIKEIFTTHRGRYGHRRIWVELARQGWRASKRLVRQLMRDQDLVPVQPKPYRRTTIPDADAAAATPDLVKRDFTADAPGRKLFGDISYIRTWEGWLYIASVIDAHTKAVIGWAMADHMRTDLICDALHMAARNYPINKDAIFHSDRGVQYMSQQFQEVLEHYQIRPSVGRTGICWDNALAESFWAALKNELVYQKVYPTRRKAYADIANYIELYYNRQRLHSGLDYKTPHEVYLEYLNQHQAA